MRTKRTYMSMIGMPLAVLISYFLLSCERIKDNLDDCGIYLEFVYEYNMEYSDSFNPQVPSVDVFVFDEQGAYLFTKRSPREALSGDQKMFLGGDLTFGKYKIVTIGGLSDSFRVSDGTRRALTPGQTLLDDVQISLVREAGTVSHEFPPLWIGNTIDIHYQADLSVWPVSLVKMTNHFNLILSKANASQDEKEQDKTDKIAYTFEIKTPEGAIYAHDLSPKSRETVIYQPYSLQQGDDEEALSEAHINTARLLHRNGYDYQLSVRSQKTGNILWEYDLMTLLEHTKPTSRPDGTSLSMQEYLDRQSEWNIILLYKDDEPVGDPDGFTAIRIIINDWIIWLNDVEI